MAVWHQTAVCHDMSTDDGPQVATRKVWTWGPRLGAFDASISGLCQRVCSKTKVCKAFQFLCSCGLRSGQRGGARLDRFEAVFNLT